VKRVGIAAAVYALTLAPALSLLLAPAAAHAQTVEIQREVQTKLWLRWTLERIEAAAGALPVFSILTFIALVILITASIWFWRARRRIHVSQDRALPKESDS
jgi:hypothetical protein